jgi:Na+/H+ antiporter NhaD/arsenite permease-like protein
VLAIPPAASWAGPLCLALFAAAYAAVIVEERLHLRKSIPVLLAAGAIWVLIGAAFALAGDTHTVAEAARHNVLEFAELFLFLIVAMTFVNTLEERGVFDALRAWLVGRGYSYRTVFWLTGALAFVLSPVADNLTTALVLGAVVMAVGAGRPRFVTLACVNVIAAANAGGAFSPFGDVTTLMVWQKGVVEFGEFFALALPSLVTWLVPALLLSLWVERGAPPAEAIRPRLEEGALAVVALFIATVALTVVIHSTVHLPPAVGMMLGLGLLKAYAYGAGVLRQHRQAQTASEGRTGVEDEDTEDGEEDDLSDTFAASEMGASPGAGPPPSPQHAGATPAAFDVFRQLERVEWDTLLFFYGVLLCVGGLGTLGYLTSLSRLLYTGLGPTAANVLVGLLSAVIDNVPVMFAVLSMNPDMSHGQWLLVTLTAGVGGSMLSIGSAAGVALMGLARGAYTFGAHLRWSWAVLLGYAAGVGTHLVLNQHLF